MRRVTLAGPDGSPAISYTEGERYGLPCADQVEALSPDAAGVILEKLPGWAVAGPPDLGRELLAHGARLRRHAHQMTCDLRTAPPADAAAPEGFRFVPCDRAPEDVFPAWRAAYPPGHVDHRPRDGATGLREELAPLLAGEILGELLPCSVLAVDEGDTVAGGVLVNRFGDLAWVTEVFRHPGRTPAGLGARMLGAVRERAYATGWDRLGLAVTEGNPARRVYERLGFTLVHSSMTVVIPGVAAT
ncbi:GNAT family N-acetyltransferase [Microbispora cellulosiformans]|uniref:GNAT family N-acetyltransferase n=1 Tax=Microbispora cellulosiformans TaxID=2614688 RepID=A0A5J5JTD9_9ACTN|nr:GNAT family N-acetyltransferase [Microbispora cellulosiformans]KAA9373891.1 GNAT family N-acetyltransferase [Microbispora cellulosiformans]